MKAVLMALSAALFCCGGVSQAANRDVAEYLQRAGAAATVELARAGVDVGKGLTLRARVGSDGRLSNARLVASSGSLEADRRAEKALRRLKVNGPPAALIGADVRIAVEAEPVASAGD